MALELINRKTHKSALRRAKRHAEKYIREAFWEGRVAGEMAASIMEASDRLERIIEEWKENS